MHIGCVWFFHAIHLIPPPLGDVGRLQTLLAPLGWNKGAPFRCACLVPHSHSCGWAWYTLPHTPFIWSICHQTWRTWRCHGALTTPSRHSGSRVGAQIRQSRGAWFMVEEEVCCVCSLFPDCVFKQLSTDNTNWLKFWRALWHSRAWGNVLQMQGETVHPWSMILSPHSFALRKYSRTACLEMCRHAGGRHAGDDPLGLGFWGGGGCRLVLQSQRR